MLTPLMEVWRCAIKNTVYAIGLPQRMRPANVRCIPVTAYSNEIRQVIVYLNDASLKIFSREFEGKVEAVIVYDHPTEHGPWIDDAEGYDVVEVIEHHDLEFLFKCPKTLGFRKVMDDLADSGFSLLFFPDDFAELPFEDELADHLKNCKHCQNRVSDLIQRYWL